MKYKRLFNKSGEGIRRPHQIMFRGELENVEFVERLAFGKTGGRQEVIESRVYPAGWRAELARLRREHRAAGIPDSRFYPPQIQKKMGVPAARGRRALFRTATSPFRSRAGLR